MSAAAGYVGEYVDNIGDVERHVLLEVEARETFAALGIDPETFGEDDGVLGDEWVEW